MLSRLCNVSPPSPSKMPSVKAPQTHPQKKSAQTKDRQKRALLLHEFCFAMFQAFCKPAYCKDFALEEVIFSLGETPRAVQQAQYQYAMEYWQWQDELIALETALEDEEEAI